MKQQLQNYFSTPLRWNGYQIGIYIVGIVLFSLGAKGFIDAKLGTDPLDVLVIGMTKHLPFQIGTCSSLVAIFFLLWWTIWNKKIPPISPFISTAAVGYLIDFWNAIQLERFTIDALPLLEMNVAQTQLNFSAVLLVVVSLISCSYASALIIMSGIGIRIMDLVGITMIEKWGWSFFRAKMLLEILLFTTGWLLGGPMGFTTIAFLFLVGPFIQPFMWVNTKYFRMPNYGIG